MNAPFKRGVGTRIQATRYEPASHRNSGDGSHIIARDKALWGSIRLKEQMQIAFGRFEMRHGLEPGEGQFLLMTTGLAEQRQ